MALALALGVVTCLLTLAAGYPFVHWLKRLGLGKKVREDGPSTHIEKTGTPTMGGLLFCVNEDGIVHVVRPAENRPVLVDSCPFEEPVLCTPAATDGGGEGGDLPKLWYINPLTSYELYNTSQQVFEDSAAELGYEAFTAGSATVDAAEQITLINQAIASGADGVIFCNIDPAAYESTIKDAQAKGIVMITTGGCIDEISNYSVGTDNVEYGEVAAQTIADEVGKDAKVVIFGTNESVPNQVVIRDAFEAFAAKNFPDMEILSFQPTNADPAEAATKITAAVAAYPEATAFWHIEGAGLSAAPSALEQAGLAPGDMFVLGVDATPETLAAIEDGWVTSTLAQCFFWATPFAAQLALDALAGTGPTQQSFNVGVVPVGKADLPFKGCPDSAYPSIA